MKRRGLIFVLVCLVLTAGTATAAAPNDPGWSQQWHLAKIHADRAWTKSKGAGVVVAVVDTGVDSSHPDLQGRLVSGVDLIDGGTPEDEQGHGTFMAGIISATTGNVEGVASVAPAAKIMPVRVLDDKGVGKPSVVAEGINWAVAHGAEVINLSLAQEAIGGSGGSGVNLFADTSMDDAIKSAAASGAVVVAAAGNDFSGGSSTTSYASNTAGVIVVGASTKTDRRAAYSNYGTGLDVLAPGGGSSSNPSGGACTKSISIVSTWWNPSSRSSAYGSGCGTSMAVAHVSGIAALLIARGYSNGSAVRRIEATAVDLYSPGKDTQSGYGRVDAAAAVGASIAAPSRPKTTPRSTQRPPPGAAQPVGAAGTKPAVKGTKISPPPLSPVLSVKLVSAGPFEDPPDPKLHLIALALAMAVGLAVAHAAARTSSYRSDAR
jgi:subtilisin family serine protease